MEKHSTLFVMPLPCNPTTFGGTTHTKMNVFQQLMSRKFTLNEIRPPVLPIPPNQSPQLVRYTREIRSLSWKIWIHSIILIWYWFNEDTPFQFIIEMFRCDCAAILLSHTKLYTTNSNYSLVKPWKHVTLDPIEIRTKFNNWMWCNSCIIMVPKLQCERNLCRQSSA